MATAVRDSVDRRHHGFAWRESPGRADGPTVVLLHGLMGSRLSWEPQLGALGDGVRTVAWDVPGYGDSTPLAQPATFALLGDAVTRFIDVIGAEQVHLVGISFGGMIAQYAAADHADRIATLSLLATSPCFGLDGTQPDEWRQARLAPLDAGLGPTDFAQDVLRGIGGPSLGAAALDGQVAAARRVGVAGLRSSIECLVTHDSRALLADISAPTLCLVGEHDTETPPSYAASMADLVPDAELRVISGAGHLLNVEAPGAINELLGHHIASHP